MQTITVKQFKDMGYKAAGEIHWTAPRPKPEELKGYKVFAVGFEVKGKITPFALWLVK
jgi:hypothetical protein